VSATPEQIAERLRTIDGYLNSLWDRAAKLRDQNTGQAHADLNELRHGIGAIPDGLLEAANALTAQAERVRVLEAEVAKLSKPEWFYNADDGEYSYGDVDDVVDDMGYEGVMRVAGARQCWRKWVAVRCVALDVAGDIDETEVMTFETEAEALRCWPESLAACRARAALNAAP
jgi:hypothetical protein